MLAGGFNGGLQLGPLIALAAFYFHELGHDTGWITDKGALDLMREEVSRQHKRR